MRAWLAGLVVVCACGGQDLQHNSDANGGGDGAIDAASDGWTTLISRGWSIAAGSLNIYECRRIQVPQDMWIGGFRSLSPLGTHHEVLTIDPSDTQTGDYDCDVGAGTLSGQMLYAAGINTDDLTLPTGVAIHLTAGTWINLNLHLFDASDSTPYSGESGILVQTVAPGDVVHEADMVFSGTYQIDIPSDGQTHTAQGGCAAPTDWHVFALWPHMHQIATHQLLTVTPMGGALTTMLDTPYSFQEQKNYPMSEIVFHQGDRIETTCSYVNTTGTPVDFCDSSLCEMCFTGMYKYPAGGGTLACVDK